jgi:hypothetical protein
MNQNGFSTGEEDSRGPLDKICCLQEDGFRCQRQAGNASYSKKIRNTVRQLKLHLDAVVSLNIYFRHKIFFKLNNILLGKTYIHL